MNGVRHNLTKSQRAMAIAKLFPESGKGGRGKTNPVLNTGFLSAEYVRKARTVLKYTPETAKQVLVGSKSLDEAYRDAQRQQQAQDGRPELATRALLTPDGHASRQVAPLLRRPVD